MKKLTVMIVIMFAMITLGSVCGAGDKTGDKTGYVVKEKFEVTPVSGKGEVYCAKNDFVTGCSYSFESYLPPYTDLSDYTFHHVIPIGCTPNLKDKDAGRAVCAGCLVDLTVINLPSGLPSDLTLATFYAYAYCGRQ